MKLKRLFSRKKRRKAGFSLIDTAVGMGVMGTAMAALLSGFTTGFFTMQLARENLRATQIMLEKMETIRLYSWDQINTPGFIPANFAANYDPNASQGEQGAVYTGSMVVTNGPTGTSYGGDLRLVTVTVNWQTGGLNRTRSFSSYIARDGLQNYIY